MKKIGIIGSRRRNTRSDFLLVEEAFFKIWNKDKEDDRDWIISGGCPKGGDHFAEILAKKWGVPILIFYPIKQRREYFFKRNTEIARNSDLLIACVAYDRKGGTEDTIKKYLRLCEVHDLKEELILV